MRNIRDLEIHVAHSCNLSCESCSHYSNQGHTGILSLNEADNWMKLWNNRINPKIFSLLGGEPTIHPNLTEFISLSRKNWPNTTLRIVTNGFFLHRHPDLPLILKEDSNAIIHLSIHHYLPEYQVKLKPILELLDKWKKLGVNVSYENAYDRWTRRYHGFGSSMSPYTDNDPRKSWETCPSRCYQLFEGNIWKCAPLAYLKLQDEKYNLSNEWEPYLEYRPLTPDCTDEELNAFFDQEEESFCGMCSTNREKFDPPLPLRQNSDRRYPNAEPKIEMSNQTSSSWIKELPKLDEDKQKGWKPYPIFNGSTHCLDKFSSHMSILSPGITPHELHSHQEEELHIMLSGEIEIVRLDKEITNSKTIERLTPGSFVYYHAFQPHTILNVGSKPAIYLIFSWRTDEASEKNQLKTTIFRYSKSSTRNSIESTNEMLQTQIFDNPTRYLDKLHCHITTLQPGAGYPPHADSYDVAILLLQGTIETLDRQVNSQAVIFYAAGEPHGMKNIGDIPASYLVFEFHRDAKKLKLMQKTNIPSRKTDDRLSLCIFSHSSQLGGSERSLLELVTELIKDYNVNCHVVLPREGPLKQKLEKTGASVFILNYSWWCDTISLPQDHMSNKLHTSLRNVIKFARETLNQLNPDIILTNTITVPWGAITAYFMDKPHIWYIREYGVLDHGLKFFQPFNIILDFIQNSSNLILTNSDNVTKQLFGDDDKTNISIIPTYIEIPSETITQDKNTYFFRKNSIKLAVAGIISESKGQLDAILAVKQLIKRNKNVELIIIGEANPDYLQRLKKIVEEENLTQSIRFLDFKENPYGILNQADIILTCSRHEAFGRTTLEAMLLKKPVIGTNTGGTPKLIKEKFNGLLYTPNNFMELAEKIEYFINNSDKLVEFGENGYTFANNNFSKKEYGGNVHKLLNELKEEKNPQSLLYSILMKEFTYELMKEKYRYQQLINENKIISEELNEVKSELRNSITLQFARKIPFGNYLRKLLVRFIGS